MENNNNTIKGDEQNEVSGAQTPSMSYTDLIQKARVTNDEDRQRFIIVLRELCGVIKGDVMKGASIAEGLVVCLAKTESKAALAELKRMFSNGGSSVDASTIVEAFKSMTNEQLKAISNMLEQYLNAHGDDKVSPEGVVNAFQHMSETQITAVATVLGDAIKSAVAQSMTELEDTTYQTLWDKLSKHLTLGYLTTLVSRSDAESRAAFKQALEELLRLKSVDDEALNTAITHYLNELTPQQWASYIDASQVHVDAPEISIASIVDALKNGTTEQRAVARDVLLELLNISISPQQVKSAVDEYLISLTAEQLTALLPSLSSIIDDQIAAVIEYLRANSAFTCDLTEQTKQMASIRKPQQE